jgi:hypothetical protein
MKGLNKLGVNVVLGERVVEWPDSPERLDGSGAFGRYTEAIISRC